MTEIRLEEQHIVRIVAQVLRDEYKMTPGLANEVAVAIGIRLRSSLPSPGAPHLYGSKLIRHSPPLDFLSAFTKMAKESGRVGGHEAWDLVYDHATEVPAVVADAVNY